MTTMAYSGKLVVTSCWCGIRLAVPSSLYEFANRNHSQGIYCPIGHTFVFSGQTALEEIKAELAAERRYIESLNRTVTSLNDRIDTVSRSRAAVKGQLTKTKKLIDRGLCPYGCRRHFADVARHIKSQHDGQELPDGPPQTD